MIELFKGLKVDWLGKRKLFFSISMALLLVGMTSLVLKRGFEYGTDFKGGTVVVVRFKEPVRIEMIRELLPDASCAASRALRKPRNSSIRPTSRRTWTGRCG